MTEQRRFHLTAPSTVFKALGLSPEKLAESVLCEGFGVHRTPTVALPLVPVMARRFLQVAEVAFAAGRLAATAQATRAAARGEG